MRCARLKTSIPSIAIVAALLALSLSAPSANAGLRKLRQSSPQASSSSSATAPNNSTSTKKKSKKRHSRREPTQKAPTPDRIKEIQSALARGGYYQGEPNGKWDLNTASAMQKFQSGNGLEPSGKINALSLQKLGLGSEIAGVSAPRPVAPLGTPAPVAPSPAPAHPPSTPPSSITNSASAVKPPVP
jgi:peptidoglycan hydrolase-like protein with peptidoglycan-binding domain